MAAALLTATLMSLAGLLTTTVLGLTVSGDGDLLRHATFGVFATMITLLSHSLLMFYLIGKGRAVRQAAAEGGLPATYAAEIARLGRPVFSIGALTLALTMMTAILGASVDTRVLPPAVHAGLAYASIAANLATLRVEMIALSASGRIVSEVNRRLKA